MTLYNYVRLFSPFIFATSFMLSPVQGTTPSFIMLLTLVAFAVVNPDVYKKEIKLFSLFFFIYLSYILISQFGVAVSVFKPAYALPTISQVYSSEPFQASTITQSIYLIPCLISVLLFRKLTFSQGLQLIRYSALFLGLYGIYEVLFYVIFNTSGDFLSNRTFADGQQTGSAFQKLDLGLISIQRLKSLTLEPSVYGYTILPVAVLLSFTKYIKSAAFLAITLLLSTSGTFFLGFATLSTILIFRLLFKIITTGKAPKLIIYFILASLSTLLVISILFPSFFYGLLEFLINKFSGVSQSGTARTGHFILGFDYWLNEMNLFLKLFGVGFGVVRPTNMLMFLLINVGLIGLILYLIIFLYPLYFLPKTEISTGLKLAVVSHLTMSMSAIPEFSVLTPWIFLGLCFSYNKSYVDVINKEPL